ncbi:hypothetical protein CDCA_CDCA08G2542 [Cyanidium caldarium]|uniref:Uncharacterized protein n=1 Tax=Cyanidium caldarium TaxID=2771 RepID=A0AAV9IW12_CYACA|nr:hypothetical protein CDCA_CDCA08G2542 [Cyanidium caldarium]
MGSVDWRALVVTILRRMAAAVGTAWRRVLWPAVRQMGARMYPWLPPLWRRLYDVWLRRTVHLRRCWRRVAERYGLRQLYTTVAAALGEAWRRLLQWYRQRPWQALLERSTALVQRVHVRFEIEPDAQPPTTLERSNMFESASSDSSRLTSSDEWQPTPAESLSQADESGIARFWQECSSRTVAACAPPSPWPDPTAPSQSTDDDSDSTAHPPSLPRRQKPRKERAVLQLIDFDDASL